LAFTPLIKTQVKILSPQKADAIKTDRASFGKRAASAVKNRWYRTSIYNFWSSKSQV